jgi:heme/copper-type cytochrome/quinol oxidase subunit 3
MEIPYTVRPRPDTGLANPKLGIWLFLASEVMLFGGLFAGYIFMRLGAEPWMWPKGWLNVPVGTFNTFVLILSSVTVILAWESLKLRNLKAYKFWLATTWICGLLFLVIKLSYEWPSKFKHFGAYIQKSAAEKYEPLLGNDTHDGKPGHVERKKSDKYPDGFPRLFIGGHLDTDNDKDAMKASSVPFIPEANLDSVLALGKDEKNPEKQAKLFHTRDVMLEKIVVRSEDIATLKAPNLDPKKKAEILHRMNTISVHAVDAENAKPYNPDNDKAHFMPRKQSNISELGMKDSPIIHTAKGEQHLVIDKRDLVAGHGPLVPKLNTYLATYFMITGLHGAHVLAGCICFIYFWLPIKGGSKLFYTNPEQLCNRIEVSGLFWHLVDLIWIFVFPIFYLL